MGGRGGRGKNRGGRGIRSRSRNDSREGSGSKECSGSKEGSGCGSGSDKTTTNYKKLHKVREGKELITESKKELDESEEDLERELKELEEEMEKELNEATANSKGGRGDDNYISDEKLKADDNSNEDISLKIQRRRRKLKDNS
ncbi:hypothetical protein Glove_19g401 [Diversispora epigaea]|uniref:Uncharacterized protein n=1 Tax=Diversispora epigaea TaxID=1348612 RepID=A0A397JL32_9GLOM|nr:hypothetical protein Glove_19g401 [Diversispora epigaea]